MLIITFQDLFDEMFVSKQRLNFNINTLTLISNAPIFNLTLYG